MIKLYGFAPARSIRVAWTLRELGIEHEIVPINLMAGEHRKPEFLKINPAGKVPVLVDGDVTLTESVAIVLYLAEKHADRGLMPATLAERAELNKWLLFTVTELEQPLWRIAKHTALYPKDRRSPAEIENARKDFKDMAAVLEQHMTGREHIVGDRVSVADFVAGYTLDWAHMVQLLEGFPQLSAYMERLYARPKAPQRIVEAFASVRR